MRRFAVRARLLAAFMLAIIPACSTDPDNPGSNDAGLPENLVIIQPDSDIPSPLKNLFGISRGRYENRGDVAVAVTKIDLDSKTATVFYAWGTSRKTEPGFVQVTATIIGASIKAVWYWQHGVDDFQSKRSTLTLTYDEASGKVRLRLKRENKTWGRTSIVNADLSKVPYESVVAEPEIRAENLPGTWDGKLTIDRILDRCPRHTTLEATLNITGADNPGAIEGILKLPACELWGPEKTTFLEGEIRGDTFVFTLPQRTRNRRHWQFGVKMARRGDQWVLVGDLEGSFFEEENGRKYPKSGAVLFTRRSVR